MNTNLTAVSSGYFGSSLLYHGDLSGLWFTEIEPVQLEGFDQQPVEQSWLTSIHSAFTAVSNFLGSINMLPMAEAAQVRPKVRITTEDCDLDHTLDQNDQCHVMVKIEDGWTTRYPSNHPSFAGILQRAREQRNQVSPLLANGKMFQLEDIQYGPAWKGVILDNHLDCLDFATVDYFRDHKVANDYILSAAASTLRQDRVSRGYMLPLQDRKEVDQLDLKNGDIALLVYNASGEGGVPVHVGRVVVNPNDNSLWIADKAGSGGYYLSAMENWLFENPMGAALL